MVEGKAAFIVRTPGNVQDCLRSAAGLAIENYEVAIYVIGVSLADCGPGGELKDKLEMIDDVEGELFTTVKEDEVLWPFVRFMPLEEMARKLPEYDPIVPF